LLAKLEKKETTLGLILCGLKEFAEFVGTLFSSANWYWPLVDEIRKYEKVQISLKDIDTSLQRYPGQNPAVGDRFTFVVPYCKKELTWTVICNAQSPSTPPDILLSEGEENFVSFENLVSIKQWNPQQSDALLRILLELLSCFRDYQKQLIAKFPNDRIRFECETVANVEGVEMYLNTVGSHHEVDCMVPLNDVNLLQLSGLSICLPVAGPHGNTDSSVYSLTLYAKFFPDITDKEPELSLVIPKFWEEKLPFLSHLKLPEWTKNMCLVEYISQIKDTLTEVFDGLKLRKRLILEFKNQMEASPLEYDSMTYRRISFLYVVDSVPVVLHVFVPWLFPKECPQLLLQSVMYSGSGHPLQRLIVDYPYSPRWDVTELVRRLKALLPNNLIQFKRECEVSRSNG